MLRHIPWRFLHFALLSGLLLVASFTFCLDYRVRSVFRRIVAVALVLPLAGCAIALTTERISPTDKQMDFVREVTSAYRRPSGAVVVCVKGEPAHTPWPFADQDAAFSLILPPGAAVQVPQSVRHLTTPEYQLTAADVGGACPDKIDPAAALPVRRPEPGQLGDTGYALDYDRLAPHLGPGAEVWVINTGYRGIVVVDESPRFEGRRAVIIQTGDREVEGQPAYILLLPFAVVWDVLMSPIYLLMALAGGPHGRG